MWVGKWVGCFCASHLEVIERIGRGGRIRTFDLLVPNQALYQAEPRPELSSLVCCTPPAQARTIEFVSDSSKLRELPAVHEVLELLAPSLDRFPRELVLHEVRTAVDAARARILAGAPAELDISAAVVRALAAWEQPSQRAVINATGVVLHTNLGRAPLPPHAGAGGYTNLEYDLAGGRRGKRDAHTAQLLQRLLGAPAIAVNNNAAAVFLALLELAAGGEAIVSRGGPNGQRIYGLRVTPPIRAVAYRDDDLLRFLSLHRDHDSAYR